MIKWLVITSAFSLAQRLEDKDEKALPCDWGKAYKALGLINSSANNSNDKIKSQISKFTIGLPSHFHLIIILIAFFFACLFVWLLLFRDWISPCPAVLKLLCRPG